MVRKIGFSLFFILWIGVVFSEYLFQHPWYEGVLNYFDYYEFLIPLLLAVVGLSFLWKSVKKKNEPTSFAAFNGLSLFGILFVISFVVSIIFFTNFEQGTFTGEGAAKLFASFIGIGLSIFLCTLFAYTLGDLVTFLFPVNLPPSELKLIKIGIGIMFLVGLAFFLGIFHLFNGYIIGALFILFTILNLKGAIDFVKDTLWKPIPISPNLNLLGISAFAIILTFVSLNFTQIIRPIPIGFDAMTLYMRLPSLINDYHGLVDGHQPYNWSLFMALGFVVFDSTAVTLGLSFVGGILSLFALYFLAKKWMNCNLALLVLAIFYTMPQVNFLSYQDMKIDMGLLFISLCSFFILLNLVKPFKANSEPIPDPLEAQPTQAVKKKGKKGAKNSRKRSVAKKKSKAKEQFPKFPFLLKWKKALDRPLPAFFQGQQDFILLGIFLGFAVGIKLTAFILLTSIIVVLWYVKGNSISTLAILFLLFFGVLLAKLDELSGMRNWHENVEIVMGCLGLIGLLLLGYVFLKYRQIFINLMKPTLVMMLLFSLTFSPWLIKNIIEIDNYSMRGVLNGSTAFPNIEDNEELVKLKNQAQYERDNLGKNK